MELARVSPPTCVALIVSVAFAVGILADLPVFARCVLCAHGEAVAQAPVLELGHPLRTAAHAVVMAAGECDGAEELQRQRRRYARAAAARVLAVFGTGLDSEIVGDAVAQQARGEALAIVRALHAEIAAYGARFDAPVGEILAQQRGVAEEVLHQDRLAAEDVAHHDARLAAAGDLRQVLDGERPGRHLRGLPQRVVDVELDGARRERLAADGRDRLRDEARRECEVGAPLHAAEVEAAPPRAGAGRAVAQAQARVHLGVVAREGGLQAHIARRIGRVRLVGQVARQAGVGEHAVAAGEAELGQRAEVVDGGDPLLVAALEIDVVVEEGRGERRGHREVLLCLADVRGGEGCAAEIERQRLLRGVEARREARQRGQRIPRLAAVHERRDARVAVQPPLLEGVDRRVEHALVLE
jgi:hypothetical protein